MNDLEYMEQLAASSDPDDRDKALKFYQDQYIKQNGKPGKNAAIAWERKTAADILRTEYPALKWIVPNIIPEGLSKVDGPPKVGKSWFALHLATAVSYGGSFMGSIPVTQRECLYLALEDGFPRIKDRLIKQGGLGNDKLFIETPSTWKGGIGALQSYVKKFPETGLIIIDTLFKFQPLDDSNEYSKTYKPLSVIQELASKTGIAIVLIHHTRKNNGASENWADSGLGSQGLAGAVDTVILLQKKDGKNEGSMYVKGRDCEEKSFNLLFDRDLCTWRITGEGEIAKGDPRAQTEVLSLLEENPDGLKTSEIAAMLGKQANAICNILKTLDGKGKAKKQDNKWFYSQIHNNSEMNNSENMNNKDSQIHIPLEDNENVNKKELDIY